MRFDDVARCFVPFVYTRGVYNAFAAMKKDAERKKGGGGRGRKSQS